jgi:hypothetical protein
MANHAALLLRGALLAYILASPFVDHRVPGLHANWLVAAWFLLLVATVMRDTVTGLLAAVATTIFLVRRGRPALLLQPRQHQTQLSAGPSTEKFTTGPGHRVGSPIRATDVLPSQEGLLSVQNNSANGVDGPFATGEDAAALAEVWAPRPA